MSVLSQANRKETVTETKPLSMHTQNVTKTKRDISVLGATTEHSELADTGLYLFFLSWSGGLGVWSAWSDPTAKVILSVAPNAAMAAKKAKRELQTVLRSG